MEVPLVDDTADFFFWDTVLRLKRVAEGACGYGLFALLLYCRFACPGGADIWSWLEPSGLWAFVFLPLFLLDMRNFFHFKYMRAHVQQFPLQDARRYLLICTSESLFKVLLCVHLMFQPVRRYITFQVAMLPYVLGYVLHFILGHFVPMDAGDRAEGCNTVASVLSDLFRFLTFVLLVSLSLKIESKKRTVYDWQAAFWPCWGLEGIILLDTALFLPICLSSICGDRPRVFVLTWLLLSGLAFGCASFVSVYNVVKVLDDRLCPLLPCPPLPPRLGCKECQRHLELVFLPWLIFLPSFAAVTLLFRRRLARALHEAWYQPPQQGSRAAAPVRAANLPQPAVLFRVQATFYARGYDAAAREPAALLLSTNSQTRTSLDPSSSILSARGAAFDDIVESERLCFICYSEAPDAALLECGHAGLCTTCALHLLQRQAEAVCPICRGAISMIVRLRRDLPLPDRLFQTEQASTSPTRATVEDGLPGPPWPLAAKRCAVVVEPIQAQANVQPRWWRSTRPT